MSESEPLRSKSLHHVAYATRDPEATYEFYAEARHAACSAPRTTARVRATSATSSSTWAAASALAFFEVNDVGEKPDYSTRRSRSALGLPVWVNHVAFRLDTLEELEAMTKRLHQNAASTQLHEIDHGWATIALRARPQRHHGGVLRDDPARGVRAERGRGPAPPAAAHGRDSGGDPQGDARGPPHPGLSPGAAAGWDVLLGAHESIAGGVDRAFARAVDHGGECLQIFTRNQQQWKAPPVRVAEAKRFREAAASSGLPLARVMVHASYLINLASPEPEKLRRSRRVLHSEVRRCERLGLGLLNLHPGAHMGRGERDGLARVVDSLDRLLEQTPESPVRIVLETTAGQGSYLGHRFEHLRTILDGVGRPERLAVCLDTAHSFAAGYDLSTARGYRSVMAEFDAVVGLDRLVAFHLNDTRVALGARVDRHAPIGEGRIGLGTFRRLVDEPRYARTLGLLELPEPVVAENLERLRGRRLSNK